jgi:hypothetical protein
MIGVCIGAGYLSAARQFVGVRPLSQAPRDGLRSTRRIGFHQPVRRESLKGTGMIELNPDEQEAAAEFIRMMKLLQDELDDVSNKFAAFQKGASRAADHCAEHARKLPDHPTSLLKPMLFKLAETLRMFDAPMTDTITGKGHIK